jgi:sulfur dioxygenase
MIFRQLIDTSSSTYTYLIASRKGGEALIIDPVLERVNRYIRLLDDLQLRLIKAIDTHIHADHVTGLGELRDRTRCIAVMGEQSGVYVVSMRVGDGEKVEIEGIALDAIYTPGHTSESCSFFMGDRVLTGDTLLIRGTGRTDFQNGNPVDQYHSFLNRLLKLPDETLVYPAHDYKGDTVSTIAEEKACNPRLQVGSVQEYVDIMNSLKLPNPKMLDVAVPSNLHIGLKQDRPELRDRSLDRDEALRLLERGDSALVDLRDKSERARHGDSRIRSRWLFEPVGPSRHRRAPARVGAVVGQAACVLLRLWRALSDGGGSGSSSRHRRVSHQRRSGGLEEGRRAGCALMTDVRL